jgi:hypothetical protein
MICSLQQNCYEGNFAIASLTTHDNNVIYFAATHAVIKQTRLTKQTNKTPSLRSPARNLQQLNINSNMYLKTNN